MQKIALVFNSHSGPSSRLDDVKRFFESVPNADFKLIIREVNDSERADEITKDLIKDTFDVIIAAGGDGTLNAVAKDLLNTKVKFGILPLGTLNHLAKDLGIPLDLQAALELIVGTHDVIKVDVGDCNGNIFLNNSGLGIYPRIVELREKFERKGHVKLLAYVLALFELIKNIPKFSVTLKIEGEVISKKTSFIFVGNNEYGLGGRATGTRDTLTDGQLSLWISHRTSFLGLLELLFRAVFGNLKEHRDFDVYQSEEFTVATKRRSISITFDGEVQKLESPFKYRIVPSCLNVIVPLRSEEEKQI